MTAHKFTLPEDVRNAQRVTRELHPCPFCGGQPFTIGEIDDGLRMMRYRATCGTCHAKVEYAKEYHYPLDGAREAHFVRNCLIEKWNTRKP